MKISTKFFGEVNVKDSKVIEFPKGIPGFEGERTFAILDIEGNTSFQVIQSVTESHVALVVANPYLFFKDYEFDLDESTIDRLNITSEKDVAVLVVLTLRDPFEKTTANLQAPIVINFAEKKAKQLILSNSPYHTKHNLVDSPQEEGKAHVSSNKKTK